MKEKLQKYNIFLICAAIISASIISFYTYNFFLATIFLVIMLFIILYETININKENTFVIMNKHNDWTRKIHGKLFKRRFRYSKKIIFQM